MKKSTTPAVKSKPAAKKVTKKAAPAKKAAVKAKPAAKKVAKAVAPVIALDTKGHIVTPVVAASKQIKLSGKCQNTGCCK